MFNQLELLKMASGHCALQLNEDYGWEDLPQIAEWLEKNLGIQILSRCDGVDMRIWDILYENVQFRLVYEDYPNNTSLESSSDAGDSILQRLFEKLQLISKSPA